MMNLLKENKIVSLILAVVRIYLGWTWMHGGWGKITSGGFDASGFLNNAVANPVVDKTGAVIYPTFTAFVEKFALPNVEIINVMIPWGEFLVGLGLILGCLTTAAVFFGLLMNFMFMFAGTVSTNPWMVLIGVIILIAGANAGRYGADRYVLPFIKDKFNKKKIKETTEEA